MPTSILKESDVDVLIIGAGPAGLMACNALAKNGHRVRIVDQRPNKVAAGQADGIQPRTIEVLQSYGLAERLLKEGNQMHMAAFYNPSANGGIELTDRVPDITAASARYPFEVTLHQGAIESIFLDSLHDLGIEVSRPVVPCSIKLSTDKIILADPEAYPIRVVLQHGEAGAQGEIEVVHARFAIGADGAHSWLRKAFGIDMEGEQTEYIWGVVDMIPETDFPDIRNRCVIHSDNGSCMIIPREEDKVRLYIQLDENGSTLAGNGRIDKHRVQPQQLLEAAQKSLYPYSIAAAHEFEWWTIYRIGQRVASKFSVDERIFIVGDACHTHSPKAGQGMNASINDSHNLAWKLSLVLNGSADMSLLTTYELERRKYAQDLISFDKQFAKLFSGKPQSNVCPEGVSHKDFMQIFQTFGGFTSGIGICYYDSLITNTSNQHLAKNLIVGQRTPPQIFIRAADSRPMEIQDLLPSDGRFKILVFTGNTSNASRSRMVEDAANMEALLWTLSSGSTFSLFDILSIASAKKSNIHCDLPAFYRPHWSKVLVDDYDVRGLQGGRGYESYGIDSNGAIVVVRPDGYIGMLAHLNGISELEAYFRSFLKP